MKYLLRRETQIGLKGKHLVSTENRVIWELVLAEAELC